MDEDKALHFQEDIDITDTNKDDEQLEELVVDDQKYTISESEDSKKSVEFEDSIGGEGFERESKLPEDEGGDDEDEGGDDEDDDDDERFVKKDSDLKDAGDKIMEDISSDLDEYHKELEGIRPMANKARSLAHELGGLEVAEHDGKSDEDVWDDRTLEVEAMADGEDDRLSNTNKSSLRKSSIHVEKQKKKIQRDQEKAKDGMESGEGRTLNLLEAKNDSQESHVNKLQSQRSSNSRGGGGVFGGI